jgi:tetratricopeptide (TPR) repeat protein
MNYYEILDIPRDADRAAVKRAYFDTVKRHRPEIDPEGFKAVRNAFETLYDPEKRKEYDASFSVSEDAQNYVLAARELIKQNKYMQAVEFLTGLDNDSADIKRLLAEALWLTGKNGTAETVCKSLIEKDPADFETVLLRAKIAASRGYTTKAEEYFNTAVKINPLNPDGWGEYMHFAMKHKKWMVENICRRAMDTDPGMFRDDYMSYLYPVVYEINSPLSLLFGSDSVSDFLVTCYEKFIEFLIKDENPGKLIYQSALNSVSHILDKKGFEHCVEKILPALEKCKHREEEDDEAFADIRAAAAANTLYADERIHDVFADLTGFLIAGDSDNDERLGMECFIVMELPAIRSSLKILRNEYPDYFKLNQQFYLDALNEGKREYLTGKYYAIYKRLKGVPDYDSEDERADREKPFVRENPKVGRNDPCPCGSGRKYKKCCG